MANGAPDGAPIDWTKVILWIVMGAVIGVVLVIYVGVVIDAGRKSLVEAEEPEISPALTGATTAVASALATNLGAFLGISIVTGKFSPQGLRETFKAPTVQAIFALLYVVVLFIALYYWWKDGFSEKTAEIIRTQAATLIGVGVGAFAVLLNTKLR
jgi:hypothetical protein